MTRWLGTRPHPTARSGLNDWLLSPASEAVIRERQTGIEELAAKREWRESFAVHGRLGGAAPRDLTRFLAWAESTAPAVPRQMPWSSSP